MSSKSVLYSKEKTLLALFYTKNMIAFDWIIIEKVFFKTWYFYNMHIWENYTLILSLWKCHLNWIQHFDYH